MTVEVHVVTPEREVFSGDTPLLIARGTDGMVGVMGEHIPMVVQLAPGLLRVTQEAGGEIVVVIDGGFLHVATKDGVTRADVLASVAELATEVDVAAARLALEELRSADASDPAVQRALTAAQTRASLGA